MLLYILRLLDYAHYIHQPCLTIVFLAAAIMATLEKSFDAKSATAVSPHSSFSNHDIGFVEKRQSSVRSFVDSFKPSPDWNTVKPISCSGSTSTFDVENVNSGTASSPLSRRLKGRHLQMIAIGGSIGR